MDKIIFVGVGGFIGSALRYGVSVYMQKIPGSQLPYGTLFVNVLGGVLIGFIMELSLITDLISPNLRLFLVTGILGGFTTFSTFSYETMSFISEGSYMIGILNGALNLGLSLTGVIVGRIITDIIL